MCILTLLHALAMSVVIQLSGDIVEFTFELAALVLVWSVHFW